MKLPILCYSNGITIEHDVPVIRHITVNYGSHFEFNRVECFQALQLRETSHVAYSNGLAIWHNLPDIRHIKVKYGQ